MLAKPVFGDSACSRLTAYLCASTVALALLITVLPAGAAESYRADFRIQCQVLDEFGRPKSRFRGGEIAILRLLMNIPEDVYDDQIKVRVSAEVKALGFSYQAQLPVLDVEIPEKSDRLLIDGYTPDLQEFTPFRQLDTLPDVDFDTQLAVKIPDNVPRSKFTLIAVGSIKNGGQQSCRRKIKLKR